MYPSAPRTNLYVDGYNLYYGAAKNTRLKWVNVVALAEAVLPGVQITKARYFTAKVKSSAADPSLAQRQQAYIRALETLANITVHYGHYQHKKTRAKHCNPPPTTVLVHKIEEKGTDVNIATYMLTDAFRKRCDRLILITNDSDLEEPVRIINSELNLPVIVLNPHSIDTSARKNAGGGNHKPHQSYHLKKVASRVVDIRSGGQGCHMSAAQFPHTLVGRNGNTISIPTDWL